MAKEKVELPAATHRGASISSCGLYRYTLWRYWGPGTNRLVCVGLNPSTADAETDDHTINKLMGYATRWGHDGLVVVNLFAFRATDPKDMKAAADPVGPENDAWIVAETESASKVLVCWGAHGVHLGRAEVVSKLIPVDLYSFGTTKDGHPPHPARLAWAAPVSVWRPRSSDEEKTDPGNG